MSKSAKEIEELIYLEGSLGSGGNEYLCDYTQDERIKLIEDYAKEQSKEDGWISVEDRLPKNIRSNFSAHVLTINNNGLQRIEVYDFEFDRWNITNKNHGEEVTHWQPLPDHPKQS